MRPDDVVLRMRMHMTTKNPPKRVFATLEAWVGIEPAYAALQAAA